MPFHKYFHYFIISFQRIIHSFCLTHSLIFPSPLSHSYSFAAGTTDGPGMFNFAQGTTTENPFWDRVRDFLSEPTQEEMDCQAPKPILLNTGELRA